MQCMSLFEISLLIYLILLHYSSVFIDRLYVDILCFNCNHDSSKVDVTSCHICFINFLFSSGNKITFINFCLFNMLVEIFLSVLITKMVIAFVKISKGDLLGDFSNNRTSRCKTGFSTVLSVLLCIDLDF